MMKKKRIRATSNLRMLELVARKLENLNEDVVYVGGCATGLLITDEMALDVRATLDVDCMIDILSFGAYKNFEKKLKEKGFKQELQDDVICRWRFDELMLDVVPTDEKILGFGNAWYKSAFFLPVIHEIADGLFVKSVTGPYFLAMKFDAFKNRGNNDFLASRDFEDIVTVLDGRSEIIQEITESDISVRKYLKLECLSLLSNSEFSQGLPGHLNDGSVTMDRVVRVLERVEKIANITEV